LGVKSQRRRRDQRHGGPPLGPIRTVALCGRRRGGGGGRRRKELLSYDIHNLCREAFPVQVFSP